jgi:protocatechuate 3,4-dioxygenase beta subunit
LLVYYKIEIYYMEQSKTKFIKTLLLEATSVSLLIQACKKDTIAGGSTLSSMTSGCTGKNTVTEGSYPLYNSWGSVLVRTDITEGTKIGTSLNITLTILNLNNSFTALTGAVVDNWHCDNDGYYSDYAGKPGYLGTEDYSGSTPWFRGRQTTDSNGRVNFTLIYPGLYTGRMTHIHVQKCSAANSNNEGSSNSILTTQIAFPEVIAKAEYTTFLYSAHSEKTVTFSTDNIFSDRTSTEMVTLTDNSTTAMTLHLQSMFQHNSSK